MNKAPRCVAAFFLAIALGPKPANGALATGEVYCDLVRAPFEQFPAETTAKDFFVQLPEHVAFGPSAEVKLALRPSALFLAEISAIAISLNGQQLVKTDLDTRTRTAAAEASLALRAPVPPEILVGGWNRISLQWLAGSRTNRQGLPWPGWSIWKVDSHLRVSYQRLPLFPELARFPHSIGEERLLYPDRQGASPEAPAPIVTILLPGQRRDVHLRGAAILGARLGQLDYLSDEHCRVRPLSDGARPFSECNGVVVGRWDEIAPLPLFTGLAAIMPSLKQGQGLVAEFILGNPQRRWVLATGADDVGVEKALLTLGSARALTAISPSPAVIEAEPTLPKNSTLETIVDPIRISGLYQAHQFLLRDKFLRKAAFLLPQNGSLEDVQLLFGLSMYLGKQLASSPLLWPEACGYSADAAPPAVRLQGRSVLLLGAVPQWKAGLPRGTHLAIGPPNGDTGMIRIQRRTYAFSSFEPSLTLMQMLPSPWSGEETLITLGGWKDLRAPTAKQMIAEAAPRGQLYGNLCAMDAAGRTAAYDTRRPSVESFAERIQRKMPLGLDAEQTARRAAVEESRLGRSRRWNDLVFYFGGALLFSLVAVRMFLAWDRERSRRRTMRSEKPLGITP